MLGEEERIALVQRHEWDSSGEDVEGSRTADELKGGGRLETAIEEKRSVPYFLLRSLLYG